MTWTELNKVLRDTTDEKILDDMLKKESKGDNRPLWKLRIHQRLAKLRRQRERRELFK